MVLEQVRMVDVWRAFNLDLCQVYRWEYAGKLPRRPAKRVTLEYLEALAARVQGVRGAIPQEGTDLLAAARKQKAERGRIQ
jgi:hypothetical protein